MIWNIQKLNITLIRHPKAGQFLYSVLAHSKTLTAKVRCSPVYTDAILPADVSVGSDHLTGLLLIAAAFHAGLVEDVGGDDPVALRKAVREQQVAVVGRALGAPVLPPTVTDLALLCHRPVLDKNAAVSSGRAIAQREVIDVVLVTQPWQGE